MLRDLELTLEALSLFITLGRRTFKTFQRFMLYCVTLSTLALPWVSLFLSIGQLGNF